MVVQVAMAHGWAQEQRWRLQQPGPTAPAPALPWQPSQPNSVAELDPLGPGTLTPHLGPVKTQGTERIWAGGSLHGPSRACGLSGAQAPHVPESPVLQRSWSTTAEQYEPVWASSTPWWDGGGWAGIVTATLGFPLGFALACMAVLCRSKEEEEEIPFIGGRKRNHS